MAVVDTTRRGVKAVGVKAVVVVVVETSDRTAAARLNRTIVAMRLKSEPFLIERRRENLLRTRK
jgi:hypothetical protein